MRICSLQPGATEIVYALGLEDQLYGVTSKCDYPPEARCSLRSRWLINMAALDRLQSQS